MSGGVGGSVWEYRGSVGLARVGQGLGQRKGSGKEWEAADLSPSHRHTLVTPLNSATEEIILNIDHRVSATF